MSATLKLRIPKITTSNKEDILKLADLIDQDINNNYLMVDRHMVLIRLFSKLILEFGSENFIDRKEILYVLKKEKIKRILKLIRSYYKKLILDFDFDYMPENILQQKAIALRCLLQNSDKEIYYALYPSELNP